MVKWPEDLTYRFVQEYIKYECLYNSKHPHNKIKGARHAALLRISKAINIEGFGSKDVYTKIRNLRSTYSQQIKKIKQSTISGAGTDDIYVPQIKWFKLLDDTLKATENVQCKDSQSDMSEIQSGIPLHVTDEKVNAVTDHSYTANIDVDHSYSKEPLKNHIQSWGRLTQESGSEHEVFDEEELSTSQYNSSTDATFEQKCNLGEKEEKKSPIPRKRAMRDLNSLVNNMKNVADSINTTQTESEFDIFGKSVAAQLKNMPIRLAIEGQMFIQNYLSKLRLRQMGYGTSRDPLSHQILP